MIRTVNERLPMNRYIILQRDTSGTSNILFALRSEKGADGKTAFEKQIGRQQNTLKSGMIRKYILEKDPEINIEMKDFSEEADSAILLRERLCGTKIDGAYKKLKGKVTEQTGNTITVLPKSGTSVILSKRDTAVSEEEASLANCRNNRNCQRSKK